MVDEVPFSVELDGAEAAAEKVHVHGPQHRLQQPEDGIVGGVVEVAPGDDPVDADGGERIRQEPEPLHGNPSPWLRLRRPAELGRVVVYEHGDLCGILLKHAQQDIPRGHDGVCGKEMAGFGIKKFQAGGAIEEGDVDAFFPPPMEENNFS